MTKPRLSALLPWLLLALAALPAVAPLASGGLTASFDGSAHLLRLGALQRSISEGVFLPRWMPDMQLGYGYPVFNFYPAGAYYVALIPSLFGITIYWGYAIGFAFALLLAGAGAMLLARDILSAESPWPALVAGVAYIYAPYLLINVYIRGSLPEALAQALLPWVLWSGRRVLTQAQPIGYVLIFTAFLGGLALTHSLTLMLLVPYLVGYIAVVWWNGGHTRISLRWIVFALLAAMGISSFFWLPMLFDRQFLSEAAYATARFGWLPDNVWTWGNFLDSHLLYEYDFSRPVQLGLVQIVIAAGGFLIARRYDAEWLFFALSALALLLAIGSWTLPFWQSSDALDSCPVPMAPALTGLTLPGHVDGRIGAATAPALGRLGSCQPDNCTCDRNPGAARRRNQESVRGNSTRGRTDAGAVRDQERRFGG